MSQEKLKVLGLLQDGKISTEEALKLIEQLNDDNADSRSNGFKTPPPPPKPEKPIIDFGFVDDLTKKVADIARNVSKINFDFDINWDGEPKEVFFAKSNIVGQSIRQIKIYGKNDKVSVSGYDGDTILVEAKCRTRNNEALNMQLEENDGVYSLSYDENAVRSVGVDVKIPFVEIGKIILFNKNAPITVKNVTAKKLDVETKNSRIHINKVNAKELICNTKNAEIQIEDTVAGDSELVTSNARINLDGMKADTASLRTSNAKMEIRDTNIRELSLVTSNAALYIEGFKGYFEENGNSGGQAELKAATSNGTIHFSMPKDVCCKINASTSNSSVNVEVDDLVYSVKEKRHIEAHSQGYDESTRKMRVSLHTSNSGINIR